MLVTFSPHWTKMMPIGGVDGEAGDADHSDSAHSHQDDGDIATISEVFADILTANEDLLHAAAECQLDNDAPSILAYQRLLHRNLIEMADFVDAMFGVYHQSSANTVATQEQNGTMHETAQEEDTAILANADLHDALSGDTSEDTVNSVIETRVNDATRQPERIRSLLIDRFRLENRRRSQQRSARLWKKMRRKVRVEEGVSAVNAVMFEAAERIAKLTVTGAAALTTSASTEPPVVTTPTTAPDPAPSVPLDTPSEALVTTPVAATAPATPAADMLVDSDSASEPPTSSLPASSPPAAAAQPPFRMEGVPTATSLQSIPFAPPSHQFSMSMLAASLPFAAQGGGGMLLPVGVDKFTKMPLPPMASGFGMMYPMTATPAPTLFPPDHMSSVCADCVPLNRTAHECRAVRRHITPAPVQRSQAMLFNGTALWPMTMGGPMAAMGVPQPARAVPSMPVTQSQTSFRKVCEECKKCHKSVHYCRKTLGHTAPEWLSTASTTGDGGGEDPPKRKRRSKKQRAAEEAQKAAAQHASALVRDVASVPDAPASMEANKV